MFLDYLLGTLQPSTGLHKAIKVALPTLFNIQLFRQLDTENVPETVNIFAFMAKSRELIFQQQKFSIIINGLTWNKKSLDLNQTKTVLRSLLIMPKFLPNYVALLKFCLEKISNESDVDSSIFIAISRNLINKIEQTPLFYQEEFFNRSAKAVVEQNAGLEKACFLQKQFKMIVSKVILFSF